MLVAAEKGARIPERRVLLVDTSRMFGDLIREFLRDHPEVNVVGEVHHPADLRSVICTTNANCLIVASSGDRLPADCQDLMDDYSSLKLVALVEEGRDGFIWHLEPRRVHAGAMSQEELLSVIGAE
jgi:DNA-binding NarL/FixJ family response regulator